MAPAIPYRRSTHSYQPAMPMPLPHSLCFSSFKRIRARILPTIVIIDAEEQPSTATSARGKQEEVSDE